MLLTSLGSCTAILLHAYAQNHGLGLHEVEVALWYDRTFKDDCDHCETISKYEERIEGEIKLAGKLSEKDQRKLLAIAPHCPIEKMLQNGIKVRMRLADGSFGARP